MTVQILSADGLDNATAQRLAELALKCIHREYPNKIAHALESDADAQPPRKLTPAFYGCYDWHSSVHGHWMLARIAHEFAGESLSARIKAALAKNLTAANLQREAEYLSATGRATFERPYGLAWLMQLASELRSWNDPAAKEWSAALKPLEDAAVERTRVWISKLSYPVRSGEHSNTAFSLGLMLDYARASKRSDFEALLQARARAFYLADRACPTAYEPSGEDFLSPCLAEADVMRRVLPKTEFSAWLNGFLPAIGSADWLKPAVVTDPSDGKLGHLDGLNLSRAWMLKGIAAALSPDDSRRAAIRDLADMHARDGLRAVTGEHYEGGHWLGSFAVYLLSNAGIE